MAEQESAVSLPGSRREQLAQWLSDRWASIAVIFVFLALWAGTLIFLRPLPLDDDSALFLHAGWYINQGAKLYIDIWDPKPPLTIETTALLAWLSADNLYVLYALGLLASIAGYAGLVLVAAAVVQYYTADRRASFATGLVLLLFAIGIFFPFPGYRIKSISLALGWLAIYLQLRDKPFWSGLSVAASVGYWQLSAVFMIVVFIQMFGGKKRRWGTVGGAILAAVVILLPVILTGAVPAMFQQTVLSHLQGGETQPLLERVLKIAFHLRTGAAVLIVGLYAYFRQSLSEYKQLWPVIVVTVWFIIFVFLFDYDDRDDLLSLIVCASIGIGLVVRGLSDRQGTVAIVLAALLLCGAMRMNARNLSERMSDVYWNRAIPDSCHYRLSGTERTWIENHGEACQND